jgi:hypothetical protein
LIFLSLRNPLWFDVWGVSIFVATLIHSVFWVPAKVWYGQQVRCFVGPNGVPNPCSFLGNMARVSRGPPVYVGQPHMIENSQFQCVTVCDHHPYTNVGEHKASFGVDSLACPWMLQGGLGRWSIGTPSAKKKRSDGCSILLIQLPVCFRALDLAMCQVLMMMAMTILFCCSAI